MMEDLDLKDQKSLNDIKFSSTENLFRVKFPSQNDLIKYVKYSICLIFTGGLIYLTHYLIVTYGHGNNCYCDHGLNRNIFDCQVDRNHECKTCMEFYHLENKTGKLNLEPKSNERRATILVNQVQCSENECVCNNGTSYGLGSCPTHLLEDCLGIEF